MNARLPWQLKKLPAAEELAKLKGETLPEHMAYFRDNQGGWIIGDADGRSVAVVAFRGTAKKNAYNAPDPEGLAIAKHIIEAVNSALTKKQVAV